MIKVQSTELVNGPEIGEMMKQLSKDGELEYGTIKQCFIADEDEMRRKAETLGLSYTEEGYYRVTIEGKEYFQEEVKGLINGKLYIEVEDLNLTAIEQLRIFACERLKNIRAGGLFS